MSVNSIDQMVRNCVFAQMTPYLQQFRVVKNQVDVQQQASFISKSQLQSLRSDIQQIKKQNSNLKASIARLQEKYCQNFNYSLMKCQRKIEHLCDDIKNIQIKMTNYHPNNSQKPSLQTQTPKHRSQQNTRTVQQPLKYQINFTPSEQNTQRQKQTSIIRKSEKIFRYQIDNPHNQRFQIDSQLNKIKVIYAQQWDGHCYNVIKIIDVPFNQTAKFNLKQVKTVNRYVMTGIGTSKVFGLKDVHKSSECITYFSANGNIWNQGVCTVGGRAINDGQIISVSVQRSRGLISWIVGSRVLATSEIPAFFGSQQLYWIVLLVHQNDTVQILLD